MFSDLDDAMTAVGNADTLEAMGAVLQASATRAGFESFTFLNGATRSSSSESVIMTVSKEWQTTYFSEGFLESDPVLMRALSSNAPFLWSDVKLPPSPGGRMSGAQRTMDAARDQGYRDGMTIPLQLVDGNGSPYRSLWSLYWKDAEHELPTVAARHRTYFRLLAQVWEQRLQELSPGLSTGMIGNLAVIENMRAHQALTAREVDTLCWAARGKTSAETASILGLSVETVTTHLYKATRRLGAANKTHAVAIAIHRGIISV
jgi:LuxR family quorum sensing-dependent transcriptional regulator